MAKKGLTSGLARSRLDPRSGAPSANRSHLEDRSCKSLPMNNPEARGGLHSRQSTPERKSDELQAWSDCLMDKRHRQITRLSIFVEDLASEPEITRSLSALIETLPALHALTVLSLGAPEPTQARVLIDLHESCKRHRVKFALDFVLGVEADACAVFDHMPTFLSRVLESCRILCATGMNIRWLIPLFPELIYRLETLFSLAHDERLDPVLVPTELFRSTLAFSEKELDSDQRRFVWDFINYRLLEEERQTLPAERVDFYRALQGTLGDGTSCNPSKNETVAVLKRDGEKKWVCCFEDWPALGLMGSEAPSKLRRRSWKNRLNAAACQAAEVSEVILQGTRAVVQWAVTQITAPLVRRRGKVSDERLTNVLIIGAYGGEHIGDAAILAGVLYRIHRRYGTTAAVLMSQRPDHTRHLVSMLDVPVEIKVEAYEHAQIRACLPQADAVVFAGGPLIDLPKQLVRHLYTAALSRQKDKPFIVEGIGAGPFVRWPSEWVARRLVSMAMRISVRTSQDAQQRLVRDLDPEVGRDPAFDYLETRPAELTRLPELDRYWIEKLLRGTEGRLLVGINVRPIRHLYTEAAAGRNRIEYTRFIEARFERRFAEGLQRFDQTSPVKPCFVFYPMNAIQFGMSDLRSAYRIKRLLGNEVDFRVWEADPTLDGVVALLRRLDVVVAMRLHAAIFALAHTRQVIGIDYRIGKRDKIAALLDDFDQSINCKQIDEVSADWLFERLSKLSERPPVPGYAH